MSNIGDDDIERFRRFFFETMAREMQEKLEKLFEGFAPVKVGFGFSVPCPFERATKNSSSGVELVTGLVQDIVEDGDEIYLTVLWPDLDKKSIAFSFVESRLCISATSIFGKRMEYHAEVPPTAHTVRVVARYKNGVLNVRICPP